MMMMIMIRCVSRRSESEQERLSPKRERERNDIMDYGVSNEEEERKKEEQLKRRKEKSQLVVTYVV